MVLSTGNRWSVPQSTARAAGIREIVDKPFRLEELAHAVRGRRSGPPGDRVGTGRDKGLDKKNDRSYYCGP